MKKEIKIKNLKFFINSIKTKLIFVGLMAFVILIGIISLNFYSNYKTNINSAKIERLNQKISVIKDKYNLIKEDIKKIDFIKSQIYQFLVKKDSKLLVDSVKNNINLNYADKNKLKRKFTKKCDAFYEVTY